MSCNWGKVVCTPGIEAFNLIKSFYRGPGGGFLEKSPLAKKNLLLNETSGKIGDAEHRN